MSWCMYSHGFPLAPFGIFWGRHTERHREKENLAYLVQHLKVRKLFLPRFAGCIFSNAGFHRIVRDWKGRKNLQAVYKNSSLDLICRYCSGIGRLTHQCTKIAYDTSELAAIRSQGRYFDNPTRSYSSAASGLPSALSVLLVRATADMSLCPGSGNISSKNSRNCHQRFVVSAPSLQNSCPPVVTAQAAKE